MGRNFRPVYFFYIFLYFNCGILIWANFAFSALVTKRPEHSLIVCLVEMILEREREREKKKMKKKKKSKTEEVHTQKVQN